MIHSLEYIDLVNIYKDTSRFIYLFIYLFHLQLYNKIINE